MPSNRQYIKKIKPFKVHYTVNKSSITEVQNDMIFCYNRLILNLKHPFPSLRSSTLGPTLVATAPYCYRYISGYMAMNSYECALEPGRDWSTPLE